MVCGLKVLPNSYEFGYIQTRLLCSPKEQVRHMKKDEYRRWFSDQLVLQNRLLMGAIAAMAGLGLVATLLEMVLFASIIRAGFVGSWIVAFLLTAGILGLVLFLTYLRLPKQLADREHEVELDDRITIRTAPTMTAVWTYALGSLESDRSWVERLLGMLAMPQRLFCAAYFAWRRTEQLQTIDVNTCAAVIRLLDRKAERIEVGQLVEELQLSNLEATLRNLSLIDGVMFLAQKTLGLSLTNRLVDDMAEWTRKQKAAE